MPIPGTVQITGKIAPTALTDTYPTHDANFGKGGIHHVASIAERDAIPAQRLTDGMLCTVAADGNTYQLLVGVWVIFQTGASASLPKYGTTAQRAALIPSMTAGNTGHQFYDTDDQALYVWAYDHWERPVISIGGGVRDFVGTAAEILPLDYRAGDRWTATDANYTVRVCRASPITHSAADWIAIGRQN